MKRFYLAEAPRGTSRADYTTVKGEDGRDSIGELKKYPFMVRIDRESSLSVTEQVASKIARRASQYHDLFEGDEPIDEPPGANGQE